MHLDILLHLLGLHLAVGLNCLDVLMALECVDGVVIELATVNSQSLFRFLYSWDGITYAKPLIRLYSCVILPP
jgi:hypothetical protein